MELLTAKQMCDQLQVSRETFRKTWRRFPHVFAGESESLRSARFLWDVTVMMEAAHGGTALSCPRYGRGRKSKVMPLEILPDK